MKEYIIDKFFAGWIHNKVWNQTEEQEETERVIIKKWDKRIVNLECLFDKDDFPNMKELILPKDWGNIHLVYKLVSSLTLKKIEFPDYLPYFDFLIGDCPNLEVLDLSNIKKIGKENYYSNWCFSSNVKTIIINKELRENPKLITWGKQLGIQIIDKEFLDAINIYDD